MKKVKVIFIGIIVLSLSFMFGQVYNGGFETGEPNYFSTAGSSPTAQIDLEHKLNIELACTHWG